MTSYVIERLIIILLGNSPESRFLRKTCIFKVELVILKSLFFKR